ncbi:hypothetical protein DAEQUDRAFT_755868 [Daedalea quercina L-15889]|uniref:F-box domain-containing protein n=1 Tax=Daedalea quercina L-15889 TaxID=1314783 RepID=A0A165S0G5_9APHY|nr:hypothetical protein DAEQUDRAFT_755868 [Daedalea quercina L-15889]
MERSKLCDIYSGAPFAEQLRAFPRLRSVTIHTNKVTRKWHGIAWGTLRAVLSIPHLREFKLSQLHFCPTLRHGEELNVESLAPITSFHYLLHHPRGRRSFPTETAALTAVLAKLCDRLETLVLMSESVSIDALARLRWPHLRKLVFYGTPWTNLSAPFVSLCSGMQSLRCLSLKLNPPPDTMIQPVWPQGFACSFPWPELERLVISYPDPQDQIYDHLPLSLHALSLRCWQHLYIQWFLYQKGVTYSPDRDMLLRASTMLSILQRCSTLALDHLEVEYRADEEEDALLRYIATTFPHLKSLKIHRYRPAFHHEDVHPAQIADALTPLAELSHLKLFLDFVPQKGQKDIVQEAAAVFAHSLTSSLHLVTIYYAHAIWRVFDVVAGCVHEQQMTYRG